MRVSAVKRQECDTHMHWIKNCNSTHGRVSKDKPVMADGTHMSVTTLTLIMRSCCLPGNA